MSFFLRLLKYKFVIVAIAYVIRRIFLLKKGGGLRAKKVPLRSDVAGIKLSLQKAMLGNITSDLRAVTVRLEEASKKIHVQFYYDGRIKDNTIDTVTKIIRKVDHPGYQLHHEVIKLSGSKPLPSEGELVYLRDQ